MAKKRHYSLDSVGTVITSDGVTYPMVDSSWRGDSGGHGKKAFDIVENGAVKKIYYDADAAILLSDIEPGGDWFNSLSAEDWATVRDIQNNRIQSPSEGGNDAIS